MKRSQTYSLIFIFFIIILLMNILALSSHHVVTEEKCVELEIENDSLQLTIDTMVAR
jgi:preprotein translocase subunit SecG